MISALCINLGKGKTEMNEADRSTKIDQFIQSVAAEYQPDIVFSQDAYATKNLGKIAPALSNNIVRSSFVLKKNVINENTKDHVGIFINENIFKIIDIEKECLMVLENKRVSDLQFFNEDKRAIFALVQSKSGGHMILLSSFHAKKNKITDPQRDKHINEFFAYLEGVAERVKADHILVGSDTNHKMRRFKEKNKTKTYCVQVLLYDYPENYERKINERPVYDFFMISPGLVPSSLDPKVFNVDTQVLDHHPLFMKFNYTKSTVTLQKKTTTGANCLNINPPQLPEPSSFLLSQCYEKLNQGIRNFSSTSVFSQTVQPNEIKHHYQSKPKQMQYFPKTEETSSRAETKENFVDKFVCELCKKPFDSRQGLWIHFGKNKKDHFPCKEKFDDDPDNNKNMCLRVFSTEAGVKQHKTKMRNYPRHHSPNQAFPNLVRY